MTALPINRHAAESIRDIDVRVIEKVSLSPLIIFFIVFGDFLIHSLTKIMRLLACFSIYLTVLFRFLGLVFQLSSFSRI